MFGFLVTYSQVFIYLFIPLFLFGQVGDRFEDYMSQNYRWS